MHQWLLIPIQFNKIIYLLKKIVILWQDAIVEEKDPENPIIKVEETKTTESRSPGILQTITKSKRSTFPSASTQLGQPAR